MHPVAKGAIIGAVAGAGTMGAFGLWYCTIGPSETGDCTGDHWVRGLPLYVGIGAGIGALIGALK
jgi:hypothetical protein